MRRRCLPLLVLLLAGCGTAGAAADCLTLDARAAHGEIEASITVTEPADWTVVVVHDGHVAWRGKRHGPFAYTHRMRDYKGADHVMVRITGPGGKVCTKTDLVSD
jgi:hypothetical protein